MSVPSTKVTMTIDDPSEDSDWISSMPATLAQADSMVRVTMFSTSCGPAFA